MRSEEHEHDPDEQAPGCDAQLACLLGRSDAPEGNLQTAENQHEAECPTVPEPRQLLDRWRAPAVGRQAEDGECNSSRNEQDRSEQVGKCRVMAGEGIYQKCAARRTERNSSKKEIGAPCHVRSPLTIPAISNSG
ncbi:MAG TPA: hypothetical protein VLQ79_10305 [Myxococcaceae bacterium]|nr:hypothetical protein [Myxococcaceae bacterium]